jgi:hypothetical protein
VKNINNGIIRNGNVEILDNADINKLYLSILELFTKKFDCNINASDNAGLLIEDAEAEANKFKEFSKKALQIRNNEILKSDLESFIGILDEDRFKRTLKPFQLLAAYHLAFHKCMQFFCSWVR